jgi:hypothetical protein
MKNYFVLMGLLAMSGVGSAQSLTSADATSIQGKRVQSPLACADTFVLRWVAANNRFECLAGGGVGSSPSGGSTQIQYNNAGAFGASPGLTYQAASAMHVSINGGDNVMEIQQLGAATAGQSAIRFLDVNGNEQGACGFGNLRSATSSLFGHAMFCAHGDVSNSPSTASDFLIMNESAEPGHNRYVQAQFDYTGGIHFFLRDVSTEGFTMSAAGLVTIPSIVMGAASATIADAQLLHFGPATASFPALKNTGPQFNLRLGDDSDYANFNAANMTAAGNIAFGNGRGICGAGKDAANAFRCAGQSGFGYEMWADDTQDRGLQIMKTTGNVEIGAHADGGHKLNVHGDINSTTGYKANGTAGVTVTTCTQFTLGICTAGT